MNNAILGVLLLAISTPAVSQQATAPAAPYTLALCAEYTAEQDGCINHQTAAELDAAARAVRIARAGHAVTLPQPAQSPIIREATGRK